MVQSLVVAIYEAGVVTVAEAYSSFGAELRLFQSADQLICYLRSQRELPEGTAHVAIHYPDMGGELLRTRLRLNPNACKGHDFRYTAEGWGLIRAHLAWRKGPDLSFVSANSEKRALSWASTYPQLGDPGQWNWGNVARHLRRLRRAFKITA